jgi:hypothetical protein
LKLALRSLPSYLTWCCDIFLCNYKFLLSGVILWIPVKCKCCVLCNIRKSLLSPRLNKTKCPCSYCVHYSINPLLSYLLLARTDLFVCYFYWIKQEQNDHHIVSFLMTKSEQQWAMNYFHFCFVFVKWEGRRGCMKILFLGNFDHSMLFLLTLFYSNWNFLQACMKAILILEWTGICVFSFNRNCIIVIRQDSN